ncbi:MAG: hypothetical protein AAB388_01715 [Patescibacteria group bacterium]
MNKSHFSYDSRFDVFYSDLERARTELFKRRENVALTQQLREELFLVPKLKVVLKEPHLVLFRQIASPVTETEQFIKIAKELELKPLIFEYYDDKFVGAGNPFKRGLGKLPIFKFTSATGVDVFEYRTVVDFNAYNGHLLKDVRTLRGEKLMELHHKLFEKYFQISISKCTVDLSSWFKVYNGSAADYYEALMSLFVRDAILCESFITSPAEEGFSAKVAYPAFKNVRKKYGLDPLVVRIMDKTEEYRVYWDCYPTDVDALLTKRGYS